MRLHTRRPLAIFLISSLAATALAGSAADDALANPSMKKYDIGTKDAPVDGKDGRPHEGPFVEIENLRKQDGRSSDDLPDLKDRPADPTVVDGEKIPQTNDGIMFDKNRPEPKEGTTGTSGGVSEKDKARAAKEAQTGERVENRPETPKEAPPLPHSEQEKILGSEGKDKSKAKDGQSPDEIAGFDVGWK